MSILQQKLDKAAEQFQCHNFKQALAQYEGCLAFCYRTDESHSVIFNIMTTQAALYTVLGQFDKAMSALNEVLRNDTSHYLALVRRSQLYKKKGKFNRALNDLSTVASYYPDNLQITAMKLEVENLKNRNKQANSSEESESDDGEEEDEVKLNFSNLKKIDRKSCSIVCPPTGRKSRVTISGDTAVIYEAPQDSGEGSSKAITGKQAKQKYDKTFKEMQAEGDAPEVKAAQVVVKKPSRSKSILKGRHQSIVQNMPEEEKPGQAPIPTEDKYGGRKSVLVDKIKDIDGKMITSNRSIEEGGSSKEVGFRKSLFGLQQPGQSVLDGPPQTENKPKKAGGARKSCLKRSSFEVVEKEVKENPTAKKSKFEMMNRKSIDGAVIRNRASMQIANKENRESKDDSNSDSEHNIFGGATPQISNQVSQQLGLGSGSKEVPSGAKKGRANGGKSILKKNSVMEREPSAGGRSNVSVSPSPPAKKPKKSVMFNKSRFAEEES